MTEKFQAFLISALIVLCLFGSNTNSYAQSSFCTVSGRIADTGAMPVSYASVVIYDGTTPLCGTISDREGNFKLKFDCTKTEYELVVEFIGYCRHSLSITPE